VESRQTNYRIYEIGGEAVNKSTPEYIRAREEIAKKLCNELDHEYWYKSDKISKETYRKNADSILEIKGIAILADDQTPPKENFPYILKDTSLAYWDRGQLDTINAGFKKVVE